MKKIALLISLILLITPVVSLCADLSSTAQSAPGTSNSDWCAIALLVSGNDFDKSAYTEALMKYVAEKYTTDDKLSKNKATEWHRISIAANLLGEDITDFNGINLLNDGVFYRENLGRQGLNGLIWALITVSSGEFKEPEDAINTKDSIISAVLDNAVNYLFEIKNEDGSFSDSGVPNTESTAQVIVALDAVGIDVNDVRFQGIYDALMSFEVEGGFAHTKGGEADTIATYQAMCAKAALVKSEPLYYNRVDKPVKITTPSIIVTEETPEIVTDEPTAETETETVAETETATEVMTSFVTETETAQNNHKYLIFACFAVALCVTIALAAMLRRKR